MTIAVIGGGGFIGRRLCARLAADRPATDVRVITRRQRPPPPATTVALADVRCLDALAAAVPDGASIVNLAALHGDEVRPVARYQEVNVDGARNVCDAARRRGVRRIVFSSTVAVYEPAPPGTDETGPCSPGGPYGRSKLAAEGVYRAWQAERPDERTLVIVRSAPVFGEGGGGNVARLLARMAKPRFLLIGTGRNVKSLAYVDNLAAFLHYSLRFPPGQHVYNYVDRPDMTVAALARLVRRELGLPLDARPRIPYPIALGGAAMLDVIARFTGREFAVSAARVRRFCATTAYGTSVPETGFVPPVAMADAVSRTVRSLVTCRRDRAESD